VGFLDRFRSARHKTDVGPTSGAVPQTKLRFHAVHETYPFTADDGKQIWASGYTLLDESTGAYIKLHEQHFDNPHCLLCRIAGTSHRSKVLQDGRFAPGSALMLRLEPDNPFDANAVSVWDATGTTQIGFVPAEHSERIAADMRSGSTLAGLVLREFRRPENGQRLGLHMLIVPTGLLEFVVDDEGEAEEDDEAEDEDR
jgi:hypothetical protein